MTLKGLDLKKLLVGKKLVDAKDWEGLEKEAGSKKSNVVDLLIDKKIVDEEKLSQLAAVHYKVEYVNLTNIDKIPKDTLLLVPEPIARRYGVIAFGKDNDKLKLGMTDPDDLQTRESIKKKTDLQIEPF